MNAKEYWNHKIINWEFSRYSFMGLINPASWSVRSRMRTAGDFLEDLLASHPQARILELGCGSGALVYRLKKYSEMQYWGFDISDVAIQLANRNLADWRCHFHVADIEVDQEFPVADYAVLLGVSDWISETSLSAVLKSLQTKALLISFTERKTGTRNGLYFFYRLLKDKKVNQTRTFTSQEFVEICQNSGWIVDQDLTKKAMLPGRLLWLKKSILT